MTVGYGFCEPPSQQPGPSSTKMRPTAVARKRSEADALKVRFSIPFDFIDNRVDDWEDEANPETVQTVEDDAANDVWDMPDATDLEDSEPKQSKETKLLPREKAEQKPAHTAAENVAMLFPEEKTAAPILQALVDRGLAENIPAAANIINGLGLVGKQDELVIRQAQIYRGWRDTGLSSPEAFAKTLGGMIPD